MVHLQFEAGSDVATAVVFDPSLLPNGIPRSWKAQNLALEQALRRGELLWIETGGDGSYLLDLYVDEPVPDRRGLRRAPEADRVEGLLQVPSGTLVGCGLEDVWARPGESLRSTFPNGGRAAVPPGAYRVRAWFPAFDASDEEAIEDGKRTRIDDADRGRLGRSENVGCLAFALLIAAPLLWLSGEPHWLAGLCLLTGAAAAWWCARSYRLLRSSGVLQQIEAIEAAFPTVVLHLERTDASRRERTQGVHLRA